MPRKVIKRIVPSSESIRSQKSLSFLGKILHDPNLFHINRKSAAGAFAVGLFMAYMPIPSQMIVAAIIAGFIRVNLPLSVGLVWISNPLTMPPMFYFAYKVGVWATGAPEHDFNFQLSLAWLEESIATFGPVFLLGCFICASVCSIVGYFGIQFIWRWSVVRDWQKRNASKQ